MKGGLVAAILLSALALRIGEVQGTSYRPRNDAGSYLTLASYIARTGDYSLSHNPGSGAGGTRGPSAYFAPGFPYFLALVDIIDGHETRRDGAIHPARISQAVLGTITVALIGLVALELFGEETGLIALVLAAVYPVLIELSVTLVAENLLTLLVLATVYAGLRVRRARSARTTYAWVAGAGLLTGLATLTHENAIVILFPLLVAVWTGRPRTAPRSLAAPALLIAVTVLMVLPWTIRNAVVIHHFIPVSDETGITLVGTYNVASASDPQLPYKWRIFYGIPGERTPDPRGIHPHRAGDRRSPGEPGGSLHLGPPVRAAGGRVPQHAADVRARGGVRLAGVRFGDLTAGPTRRGSASSASGCCACSPLPARSRSWLGRPRNGSGGSRSCSLSAWSGQRRDAALSRADRPVPDPAGGGGGGDGGGPATRCASRR